MNVKLCSAGETFWGFDVLGLLVSPRAAQTVALVFQPWCAPALLALLSGSVFGQQGGRGDFYPPFFLFKSPVTRLPFCQTDVCR